MKHLYDKDMAWKHINDKLKAKRTIILMLLIALAILCSGIAVIARHKSSSSLKTKARDSINSPDIESKTLQISATGDWLTHDTILQEAKQKDSSEYKFDSLVFNVQKYTQNQNAVFCTLPQLAAPDKPAKGYPRFNAPGTFVDTMKRSGCSMIGAASNHSFDYDQSYIDSTVAAFTNEQIAIAGMNKTKLDQNNITTVSVGGEQCVLLSYTTYSNIDAPPQNDYGVNVFSETLASTQIAAAKKKGLSCIIVSMRWGTEFSDQVKAQQEAQAKWLVDNGARLVLGHGTHVVQKVDVLTGPDGKKSAVLYGLGNYINSQIPVDTVTGCVFSIVLNRQTLEPQTITCRPIYNAYEWSATDKKTDNLLARRGFRMLSLSQATDDMLRAQQLDTSTAAIRSNLESVLSRGNYMVKLKD